MYCTGCGNQLAPLSKFCGKCGQKTSEQDIQSVNFNLNVEDIRISADGTAEAVFTPVSDLSADEKTAFYKKVYAHLGAYILGFILTSVVFYEMEIGYKILDVIEESSFYWILMLGAFWGVSWIGDHFSEHPTNGMPYAGPAIIILAEATIFSPLFAWVNYYHSGVLDNAIFASIVIVGAMIFAVHKSKANFEPIGAMLKVGSIVGFGFILSAIVFDFSLGSIFSWIMLALAGGYVLYDTSKIIHEYEKNQYVLASTRLLMSSLFFFWYVIRIFSSNDE